MEKNSSAGMEYAIVDIETTGGNAASGGSITEIAIRIFDGNIVIDSFDSLVKPNQRIPPYITMLTGIDDAMVQDSPSFDAIARQVYVMLVGRIFVAHNVHFDYSFIKQHLESAGYHYQAARLCTIQLARVVRPGFPSYSLGNICASLGIELTTRHRAGGDADATVALFQKLLNWDAAGIVPIMLEKGWGVSQVVPDALRDDFDALPNRPGVYYFYNEEGEVIYIGKANNLKKRVAQHFKQNNASRRRRNFTGEVSAISYEACGTELMAFILESLEIKRMTPKYNHALKKYDPKYGLFMQEDKEGYRRLKISRLGKDPYPVQVFSTHQGGINKMRELTRRFGLCASLCRLKTCELCNLIDKNNNLLCTANKPSQIYNQKVEEALAFLHENTGSFYIIDKGRNSSEKSCIWVENGSFYGMGYIDNSADIESLGDIKDSLTPYTHTHYVMQLIISFICKYPKKVVSMNDKMVSF